jgi:hypothetical protein
MTVKITYSGLGKLEDWYGHEDYYKQRTFGNVNSVMVSGDTVKMLIGKEIIKEDCVESVEIIES